MKGYSHLSNDAASVKTYRGQVGTIKMNTAATAWSLDPIVFAIPLPDRECVYLKIRRTPYRNDQRAVVFVEAARFLELWRSDPYKFHSDLASGNPQTWRRDHKCPDAERGFSFGRENPVPLALVSCAHASYTTVSYTFLRFGKREHRPEATYVNFIDGITRSIWLLSHSCQAFPVECSINDGVQRLFESAGLENTQWFTLDQLYQLLLGDETVP